MPSDAPQSKRKATEAYGAGVVEYDRYTQKRESIAEELRKEHKLTLIPPFDDPYVIAGQSTCGQELIEQTDHLDQVIVAVGGGGLIAGTALAMPVAAPGGASCLPEPVLRSVWSRAGGARHEDRAKREPCSKHGLGC